MEGWRDGGMRERRMDNRSRSLGWFPLGSL